MKDMQENDRKPGSACNPLLYGELFAGIGGFSAGFDAVGMRCSWVSEIREFCEPILKRFGPNVGDIRQFEPGGHHRVDVIAGGFPCVEISQMGSKVGIDGERSGLWSEMLRVIRTIRPRFVVVENVAAITIRGAYRVCGDLAEIGYDAEWDCLSPCMFGVPQRRDRWFLVAYDNRRIRAKPHERVVLHRQVASNDVGWSEFDAQRVRVVDGVSDRVDIGQRISSCANSVSPVITEWIGKQILAV